jgi:ADP-heptose:LPS heptosyltransferase
MHIAAAIGIPCVGLYGPTRPEDSGAYGSRHIHVQAYHQQQQRRTSDAAMQAIEVSHVIAACDQMMNRLRGRVDDADAA